MSLTLQVECPVLAQNNGEYSHQPHFERCDGDPIHLTPFSAVHAQQFTLGDPITAPPASAQLSAADFAFKFDTSGRLPRGMLGSVVPLNLTALQGTSLQQVVITLAPCSLLQPHTHVSVSIYAAYVSSRLPNV
jgi:hypothetical protein